MKKPKWRKYGNEWRRGVLRVRRGWDHRFDADVAVQHLRVWIATRRTPEAAMKAADAWWERTRRKMEGK